MNLAAIVLLSFFFSGLASGRPQLDFGDEETDEYEDNGMEREEEPDPIITTTTTRRPYIPPTTRRTTTTTTTTRRPYIPSTTRRSTTSTRVPSKRFMSGRTRNTNQRSSSRRVEQTTTPMMDLSKTVEPGLEDSTTPVSLPEEPNVDEYGNKLVYLGYRKEDYFCPEGYVLDIYGYCRAIFYEEKRDWRWWANIRNFILGGHNSGYQSSY